MSDLANIRTATSADLNAIMQIEYECFSADAFSKKQMLYLINKAKGAFWVVEQQKNIVGYISLICKANAYNLRIYSIAIASQARGQHLAQRLIEQAKQWAQTHHLSKLTLEVKITNETALKLYEKNGFKITGILPLYYHDGLAAYKMTWNSPITAKSNP